ncbi:hypothetical protein AB7813_08870 [Tardiphaga sp. 20_F10_N6_6]|uniref:hypothetical protein n=1 Tax=Tardiphaga sp. 20_F10_N6_6 TaxID=3240788 RepID=UPI003F8B6CE2
MKLLMTIAAIGVTLCTQAVAGERCTPVNYQSTVAGIRNVSGSGPIDVRPGDKLILVNSDQVGVVRLGDPTKHADLTSVVIKDCMGRASRSHIIVTGRTDVGDYHLDGNFSSVSFMALGKMWVAR